MAPSCIWEEAWDWPLNERDVLGLLRELERRR